MVSIISCARLCTAEVLTCGARLWAGAGRLERVEIAQVESLIAERRAEASAGKVVRHFSAF
jgi:hypothetical protein